MEVARGADTASVVSSRRYLLLTVAATAIAAGTAYQRVLDMTLAERRQLLEPAQVGDEGKAEASAGEEDTHSPLLFALRVFIAELSSSRLGAMVRGPWLEC
jgi:hypothetical protein